jgi:hypothetical protein
MYTLQKIRQQDIERPWETSWEILRDFLEHIPQTMPVDMGKYDDHTVDSGLTPLLDKAIYHICTLW